MEVPRIDERLAAFARNQNGNVLGLALHRVEQLMRMDDRFALFENVGIHNNAQRQFEVRTSHDDFISTGFNETARQRRKTAPFRRTDAINAFENTHESLFVDRKFHHPS